MRDFNFPYLKDADGAGARSYQVACTPHAVVLDSDLAIAYSGRIDDSRPGAAVRSRDLEAVLADIAAGRPVASRRPGRSAAASSGSPLVASGGPAASGIRPLPGPLNEKSIYLQVAAKTGCCSAKRQTQERTKSWQNRLFMNG